MSTASIPETEFAIAGSAMFTYPTRLADSWTAAILQIAVPSFKMKRPAVPVTLTNGLAATLRASDPRAHVLLKSFMRGLPPIEDRDSYLLDARHDTDGNIAHILANVVSPYLALREMFPGLKVVLRRNATSMAQHVYRLLDIPIMCTDRSVAGKVVSVLAPSPEGFRGLGLYADYFAQIDFKNYVSDTPEKVFISRKGTRALLNEDEVENVLVSRGFKKFYFEDIPINLQWSIGRNAKVVVGVHGAALSSITFNRSEIKLIELFHPGYIVRMYRFIANIVGGTWCGVTGEYPPDIIRRLDYEKMGRYFALKPTRISIDSLKMALDHAGVD